MNKIIMVGGSKGGVGKSMVAIAITENYIMQKTPVAVVESDTSNPDVGKIYGNIDGVTVGSFDLDEKEGWLALTDFIEKLPGETDAVINTAARNNLAVQEYGPLLNDNLKELKRELITFWPVNRQRDSVELLVKYLAVMTNTKTYVLYNLFYGTKDKFNVYNDSATFKNVKAGGGDSFEFPELAYRVTDIMANERKAPHKLLEQMPIGTRIEYNRWLNAVKDILDRSVFKDGGDKTGDGETDDRRQ
jgi:hypothetical protein